MNSHILSFVPKTNLGSLLLPTVSKKHTPFFL